MTTNIETYEERSGTHADHGHKFEMDIAILAYVRCSIMCKLGTLKTFKIAYNINNFDAFDDVVCRIEYEENGTLQTKVIFIQSKHRENPNKNSSSNYTPTPKDQKQVEYWLKEWNKLLGQLKKSYLNIKNQFNDESSYLKKFCNCELKDLIFLLYTNEVPLHGYFESTQDIRQIKKIFDTSGNIGIHTLTKIPENSSGAENDHLDFEHQLKLYWSQEKENCLEEEIITEIKSWLGVSDKNIRREKLDLIYTKMYKEFKNILPTKRRSFKTNEINFVDDINSLLYIHDQTTEFIMKWSKWSKIFRDDFIHDICKIFDVKNCLNISTNKLLKTVVFVQIIQVLDKFEDNIYKKLKKEYTGVLFVYIKDCDTFEMWKRVQKLYNYTKYSAILICIDYITMVDIPKIQSTDGETKEYIITISENSLTNEPSLLNVLSPVGLEQVMNYCNVNFQSFPVKLKEIFGDTYSEKMLKLLLPCVLNNEQINIGSNLPQQEEIYIDRKYQKCTTLLPFDATKDVNDLFIIYPKQITSKYLNFDETINVRSFERESEANEFFVSQEKGAQNIHLCVASTFYLEVLLSKGPLENILKFKIEQENMGDEQLVQHILNNKFTIIADDVGMGKSTEMKRLTRFIKEKMKKIWVKFIELRSQDKVLRGITRHINSTEAVELVAKKILKLDFVANILFQNKCNTDGNVALLFDGFDEISAEYRANFLHLISALSGSQIKTLVTSTRLNVAEELKICLNTCHFKLVGFNSEDMSLYLMKFWSNGIDKKYTEKLKYIVNQIVNDVNETSEIFKDIVAVPLQTAMIADTYSDKISNILSTNESKESFKLPSLNLYSLYNNFIIMHIDRCMKEKYKANDENESDYRSLKESLFKQETGIWESHACREIFPSMKMSEVTTDIDARAKQKIGIFSNIDPVTFVHRSFAEFLSAKYISKILFESKDLVLLNFIFKLVFIDISFVVLRKFINACFEYERHWENTDISHVPELDVRDSVLMCAIEENNVFLFKAILKHLSRHTHIIKIIMNHKNTLTDQSLLHVSAKHCEELFDDILNSELFHSFADTDRWGRIALHYACEYGRENAVISYLSKFHGESLIEVINVIDELGNTALWLAVKGGHCNVLKILHARGANLHYTYLGVNMYAFLLASELGHLDIVKFFVEQCCVDVNQRDDEEETALNYAIAAGKDDIIEYLEEKARAGVNIQDEDG